MHTFLYPFRSTVSKAVTARPFRVSLAILALGAVGLGFAHATITGSGNVITEKRDAKNFHALDLSAFGNAVLTQGDTEGLTLEGEDNLLPMVQTEVDAKGTLHLGFKSKEPVHPTKPLVFKVSFKALDHLVLSGSGSITGASLATKDNGDLDTLLSGSGNVSLKSLTAGGLKVSLQGSGSFTFAGTVDHQVLTLAGSGDYDAAELKSKATTIDLAGSGDCDVWATDKLNVNITGSGDVSYYGKPTVEKKITGSGSVEALGGKGQ